MPPTVIVLGGGIIGLSCAFEAARRNYAVTLLEPQELGGQASGAAAGMLAPYSENTEQPDEFFQLCRRSLQLYPEWIAAVEEHSGLSAQWVRSGSIYVAQHEADVLPLQTRLQWQNEYGAAAELVDASQLRGLEPALTEAAVAGLYTPGESHVHAPKLVAALAAACRKLGVTIMEHTAAIKQLDISPSDGVSVQLMQGIVHADRLIVCAGAWSSDYGRWLGLNIPIDPIRGQICSFEHRAEEVRHMVFSSQAYWVGKKDHRLVCGASEDVAGFDTSVTERGIQRLVRSSHEWFPFLADRKTAYRWAGLRPATRDGMPLIGAVNGIPAVIMATGHYRNGVLLSPITAQLVGDLLDNREPELAIGAFAPDRFSAVLG